MAYRRYDCTRKLLLHPLYFGNAFTTDLLNKPADDNSMRDFTMDSFKKVWSLFFLLLLLTTGMVPVFAQITNPDGELMVADKEKIWAQTLEGRYFNEFWNYQFYFDNGMKLHAVFSAANFGNLKSPVSGLRVSVYYPDGEIYQVAREYDIGRLVQDRENHRYQLHPERTVYFAGELPYEHKVVVQTTKDGVEYDFKLRFSNIERGYQLGDGFFTVHDELIGIVTHIPYAEVEGHVRVNDNHQQVRGTAYMDHTYQNQTTTRLMHSGYRFVHHKDRDNWGVLYALRPSDNREQRAIGYYLKKENGQVRLHGVNQAIIQREGRVQGTRVASTAIFRLDNGRKEVTLSRVDDQERYPLLGELGWLARRAAKTFLGGEVVDFRGEAILKKKNHDTLRGEYNFFIID